MMTFTIKKELHLMEGIQSDEIGNDVCFIHYDHLSVAAGALIKLEINKIPYFLQIYPTFTLKPNHILLPMVWI